MPDSDPMSEWFSLNERAFKDVRDGDLCPCASGQLYERCCKDWWLKLKASAEKNLIGGGPKEQTPVRAEIDFIGRCGRCPDYCKDAAEAGPRSGDNTCPLWQYAGPPTEFSVDCAPRRRERLSNAERDALQKALDVAAAYMSNWTGACPADMPDGVDPWAGCPANVDPEACYSQVQECWTEYFKSVAKAQEKIPDEKDDDGRGSS